MALEIQEKDNRFRIIWQGHFITDWLPDTPSNRKAMVVFLRSFLDEKGKHIFTFQDLSSLLTAITDRHPASI